MPTRGSYAGDPVAGDVLTAANFKKLPGGWIDLEEDSDGAGPTSGTTELTVHTASVPLDASRKIKVTWHIPKLTTTVAADDFAFRLYQGGTAFSRLTVKLAGTSTESGATITGTFNSSSAGNVTIESRVQRSAGTGTITLGSTAGNPMFQLVEDIGPSS